MCLICVELEKGKMTRQEALSAAVEFLDSDPEGKNTGLSRAHLREMLKTNLSDVDTPEWQTEWSDKDG